MADVLWMDIVSLINSDSFGDTSRHQMQFILYKIYLHFNAESNKAFLNIKESIVPRTCAHTNNTMMIA